MQIGAFDNGESPVVGIANGKTAEEGITGGWKPPAGSGKPAGRVW